MGGAVVGSSSDSAALPLSYFPNNAAFQPALQPAFQPGTAGASASAAPTAWTGAGTSDGLTGGGLSYVPRAAMGGDGTASVGTSGSSSAALTSGRSYTRFRSAFSQSTGSSFTSLPHMPGGGGSAGGISAPAAAAAAAPAPEVPQQQRQ
eukprot:TRINITY_DN17559_c0_g1_i1.p1 TRINITY_DN17559_c0_g1~~TRINITY_DN17559_c0_g1_i1.p1  ORF type:complete len:149 (-),score=5.27 TRINITY_DN17559_c0_g1_i1:729-1175(-)